MGGRFCENDADSFGDIRGYKILSASGVIRAIAGLHENRSTAGSASTGDIDFFVSNEPGIAGIDSMVTRGFLDHPRTRFAAGRGVVWMIWTAICGVDGVAELAEELGIDGLIVRHGEITASDAALVGDNDVLPPLRVKLPKKRSCAGNGPNAGRMIAVILLFHERAVPIEEYGFTVRMRHEFQN